MRTTFLSVGLILAILMSVATFTELTACAEATGAKSGGNMEWSDPAKPIVVRPGDTFNIILPSNRTTGFTWLLAQPLDGKIVRVSGSDFVASRPGVDGAPGKEIWSFHAIDRGSCTIALKYVRPWEKDRPPAKEARFTLIVR